MSGTSYVLAWLWVWGASYLIRNDPEPGRTWRELGTAIPRYFRRSYHPSQEGSLRRAVEHLAASPAARAAAGAVGRAAMS